MTFSRPLSETVRATTDRIEREKSAEFRTVMREAFDMSQDDVHVLSGDLKASGHLDFTERPGLITAEMVYGASGPAAEYAKYERARGGDHDFLARAEQHIADWMHG